MGKTQDPQAPWIQRFEARHKEAFALGHTTPHTDLFRTFSFLFPIFLNTLLPFTLRYFIASLHFFYIFPLATFLNCHFYLLLLLLTRLHRIPYTPKNVCFFFFCLSPSLLFLSPWRYSRRLFTYTTRGTFDLRLRGF